MGCLSLLCSYFIFLLVYVPQCTRLHFASLLDSSMDHTGGGSSSIVGFVQGVSESKFRKSWQIPFYRRFRHIVEFKKWLNQFISDHPQILTDEKDYSLFLGESNGSTTTPPLPSYRVVQGSVQLHETHDNNLRIALERNRKGINRIPRQGTQTENTTRYYYQGTTPQKGQWPGVTDSLGVVEFQIVNVNDKLAKRDYNENCKNHSSPLGRGGDHTLLIEGRSLAVELEIYKNGILHVRLDEIWPRNNNNNTIHYNYYSGGAAAVINRYRIPDEDVFADGELRRDWRDLDKGVSINCTHTVIAGNFGDPKVGYSVVVDHWPFAIHVHVNSLPVQTVNGAELFYWEQASRSQHETNTQQPTTNGGGGGEQEDHHPTTSTKTDNMTTNKGFITYLEDSYQLHFTDRPFGITYSPRGGGNETNAATIYDTVVKGDSSSEELKVDDNVRTLLRDLRNQRILDGVDLVGWKEAWRDSCQGHNDTLPFGPMAIGTDVEFHGAADLFGLPEKAVDLELLKPHSHNPDEPFRLFNLDTFEYEVSSTMGLYGAVPLILARHKAEAAAAFSAFVWANPSETWVSLERSGDGTARSTWVSESGVMEFVVLMGPTLDRLYQQYHTLTGYPAMPALYALAKHQCRWNYNDEDDVKEVDANFDHHNVPYDVLWLDIEHTDDKKYLTWHPQRFPTPANMLANLSAKRRRLVTIVDPHLKDSEDYHLFKECKGNGGLVRNAEGKDYTGWCWPGKSGYADFTSENVRKWWAGQFSFDKYLWSSDRLQIWNDMNEPSVFNGPEHTMEKDNLHEGGIEHRELHNAFGMYFHRATYEGLLERSEYSQRPFVLSRAFYMGSHRYGFIWTGDNKACWSHLAVSIPMILSAALAGISFIGADVGGFFHDPPTELLVRWHQLGIWYPFYRSHAHLESPRREPWTHGDEACDLIRAAVAVRYKLLPYWYTLAVQYVTQGLPMVRPLWWNGETVDSRHLDSSFYAGDAFLVVAVSEEGSRHGEGIKKTRSQTRLYLPRGPALWYDFWTGVPYWSGIEIVYQSDIQYLPVFVRAGTIVPTKERLRRSSDVMKADPYTLHVYLAPSPQADRDPAALYASGDLYADDTLSSAYLNGEFCYNRFTYARNILRAEPLEGHFRGPAGESRWDGIGKYNPPENEDRVERIVIWGLRSLPVAVGCQVADNTTTSLSFTSLAIPTNVPRNSSPIEVRAVSDTSVQSPFFYGDDVGGGPLYRVDIKKPDVHLSRYNWKILLRFEELMLSERLEEAS